MYVVKTVKEAKEITRKWKSEGMTVGLVPTMGYLHDGHLSLIKRSVADNDKTCVSVFVNPIQFGKNEDFGSYPRDMEHDSALCEQSGADLVFCPSAEEMYPEGFCSHIEISGPAEGLCGARRPGHFNGVCTVVMKLFNIMAPTHAYFGQKDAQQLAVIRRMVKDFNLDVEVCGMPIIREADGLAMSSRNTYLSAGERKAALCLSHALKEVKAQFESGERDAAKLKQSAQAVIAGEPLARIDYIEIVDIISMKPIDRLAAPALCALAVYIGRTRLIDNIALEVLK